MGKRFQTRVLLKNLALGLSAALFLNTLLVNPGAGSAPVSDNLEKQDAAPILYPRLNVNSHQLFILEAAKLRKSIQPDQKVNASTKTSPFQKINNLINNNQLHCISSPENDHQVFFLLDRPPPSLQR